MIVLFILSSCNKIKYGDVTFWHTTASPHGFVAVTIDIDTKDITSEYTSAPDCGSSGCAVFNDLETGDYNYTATDGFDSWSGIVDITEGCLTIELY